jgi:hypothetical protein
MRIVPLLSLLALSAAAGCAAPGSAVPSQATPPPPPRLTTEPWTEAFLEEAVLLARVIEIEGPDRLADQFVAQQNPGLVAVQVETVPAGLRQTFEVRAGGATVEAQLDAWHLVATQRLVVLQRPGPVEVRIRALGDAFFQRVDQDAARRGAELHFQGPVAWPD